MFTVKANNKDLSKWLDDIAQKQIPFATSKALTNTASKIGQVAAQKASQSMNIRSRWAASHKTSRIGAPPNPSASFSTIPADKRQGMSKMFATVGNVGWQMAQQIDNKDTIRKPRKAKQLWVPLNVKRTRSNSPTSMLKKKGVFVQKTSKGPIMFQRRGKQLIPLYLARKQQKIKPRFNFMQLAKQRGQKYFEYYFNQAMDQAIRTARW